VKKWRPTVRGRLAASLAGLILLTAVLLLGASYLLVTANLSQELPRDSQPERRPQGDVMLNGSPPEQRSPEDVLVGRRAEIVHHVKTALIAQYAIVLAVVAVLAALAAWLMAGRVLRPLRLITAAAGRTTRERLGERLALDGPRDELTELGDTFDSMLARLEVAFEEQQLFAANAAHELRTPFTLLRGELELALSGPDMAPDEHRALATKLLRTVAACERLTERLLSLARGQIAPADRVAVRVDLVVGERIEAARLAADERGLTVNTELGAATAHGDPELLAQLADNLIENAIRHNHPHGWITVKTHVDGARILLVVANSGEQLATQDLADLLQPFRRVERQRIGDGTGLGLSIVRTIVDIHDGQLELSALPDGGLEVRVSLAQMRQRAAPG